MDAASDEEGEQRLKYIINHEFNKEIAKKEGELREIQSRIYETKKTLDVLRYLAVTSYYSDQPQETPHPSVSYLLGNVFKIPPFTEYFIPEEKVDGRKRKRNNSVEGNEQDNVEGSIQGCVEENQLSSGDESSDDYVEGSDEGNAGGDGEDDMEESSEHNAGESSEHNGGESSEHNAGESSENNAGENSENNTEEGNSNHSMERNTDFQIEVGTDYIEEIRYDEGGVKVDVEDKFLDMHSYARSPLSYKVRLRDLQLKRQKLEDEQRNAGCCKVPQYVAPMPKAGTRGEGGTNLQVKKHVVIGNLSKFLLPTESYGDPTTHKWMLYIRSKDEKEKLEEYVEKVVVYLHPSYKPNDIVQLASAPFQLVRRGWGEFPVRVKMHFRNSRNKPIDLVHELRLDKTKVGLHTLGSETVIEIYIYE